MVVEKTETRPALNTERVLDAAIALADEHGLEALTMRALADSLGVEAMSLYYHVANKESLLDGVADSILAEVNREVAALGPREGESWRSMARRTILTARSVMLRHPWAPDVLETRTKTTPESIRYFHGLIAILRTGGLSYDLIHHAMHALGSRALGFSQEMFRPDSASDDEVDEEMIAAIANDFPLMAEMLSEVAHDDPDSTLGWCDDQTEFEFGLDLLLDGLERLGADER